MNTIYVMDQLVRSWGCLACDFI